jgi:hypothetical protein
MLSSAATAALRDIAHHIGLAAQFTAGFDYEAFVADPRCRTVISAVIGRRRSAGGSARVAGSA